MKHLLTGTALALALAFSAGSAQAEKVLVCHTTSSVTNPWVVISIAAQAWDSHEALHDESSGQRGQDGMPDPHEDHLAASADPADCGFQGEGPGEPD